MGKIDKILNKNKSDINGFKVSMEDEAHKIVIEINKDSYFGRKIGDGRQADMLVPSRGGNTHINMFTEVSPDKTSVIAIIRKYDSSQKISNEIAKKRSESWKQKGHSPGIKYFLDDIKMINFDKNDIALIDNALAKIGLKTPQNFLDDLKAAISKVNKVAEVKYDSKQRGPHRGS